MNAGCPTCGSTADQTERVVWVGGRGYVAVRECSNKLACWTRAGWFGADDPGNANDRLAVGEPAVA